MPTKESYHHLMRVRIRKSVFEKLRDIAKKESGQTGEYVSVSDIVRSSLLNWLQTYEATDRIRNIQPQPVAPQRQHQN